MFLETTEAEVEEDLLEAVDVRIGGDQLLDLDAEGGIVAQLDQPAREDHLLGTGAHLFKGRRRDPLGHRILEQLLDVLDDGEHLYGTLGSDTLDPRNIVRSVADEGLVLDHLVGADPLLGRQFRRAVGVAVALIEELDPVGENLFEVLVAAQNPDVEAGPVGEDGGGGNQVVGLEAGGAQNGDPKSLDDAVDGGELLLQLLGHLLAGSLVLGETMVAKGRLGAVESDRPVVDGEVPAQPKQQVGEGVGGLDLHSLAVGQGTHPEETTVDLIVTVDQVEGARHRMSPSERPRSSWGSGWIGSLAPCTGGGNSGSLTGIGAKL